MGAIGCLKIQGPANRIKSVGGLNLWRTIATGARYQLQLTFAKSAIASIPLVLQLKSILSLLKPMETINLKEEVRSLIDQLPENFTWSDLISAIYLRQAMKSEPIQLKGIKQGKNIQLSDFDLTQWLKSHYLRQVLKSEPIQLKGIKQGKNIQLSEKFNIPDGSEVLIEVREVSPVNPEEKLKKMKEFVTAWLDEDREEGQKIGEFLESDRTTNRKSSVMPPKKRRAPLFGSDHDLISISDGFDEPLEDFKDYM